MKRVTGMKQFKERLFGYVLIGVLLFAFTAIIKSRDDNGIKGIHAHSVLIRG